MIEAKVIADSISDTGKRITTLQLKFQRFILPEFNTHRVFSRNFSSSRAIPTAKLIQQVRTDPAMPVHWGKNQPGMQANEEMTSEEIDAAKAIWLRSAKLASDQASSLSALGAHKQIVNRLIEPYLWAHGIVTSTEWDNWFELRAHPDAQPEIHELAVKMRQAINTSKPTRLEIGEWHLPYISEDEKEDSFFKLEANRNMLKKISAARCCRVSYLKHDGTAPNIDDDLALFQRLAGSVPLHASPLEHQASPAITPFQSSGNLRGWIQFRKLWEIEMYASAQGQKF
jgi:thymidylate synthase ThyX